MEQEEKLCDEVETVREITYLGNRVSIGGGCEATVTTKTRCEWVMPRECGELLHSRGFSLKLKEVAYKSYVRPAILYGIEVLFQKENEMEILRRTERSTVRAMCGVQLKDRKRSTDLMFMTCENKIIDQLAMANSIR